MNENMEVSTVGILSPGDMGHAVGRALKDNGMKVITCLEGRSTRTRNLSRIARIEDVHTLDELVAHSDLILSIVVPSEALALSQAIAGSLADTGASCYFADCNAISPQKSIAIRKLISASGGRYIDSSIIGGPPGKGTPPRFYVSGPHHQAMNSIDGMGISVVPLGNAEGKASSIKMCYAGLTKGTSALHIALLSAAQMMGLSKELLLELAQSQPAILDAMRSGIPRIPSKAHRWIGEMDEIAATYDHIGVTPDFHHGAREIYRLLSKTSYGSERAETVDPDRSLEQTIQGLVDLLSSNSNKIND